MHTPTDTTHGGLTNDLADWFPVVEATGVKVPRTTIIPVPESFIYTLLEDEKPTDADLAVIPAVEAAAREYGYPAFLRTGEHSAKHYWKDSCFVDEPGKITSAIGTMFETQVMMFMPMPQTIVVREFLKAEPVFYAFNGTPITKERRYFVKDGKVYDNHPYWPLMSIEGHSPRDEHDIELPQSEWHDLLKGISQDDDHEELVALTEKAAANLTGAWSVDWLRVGDEWVFIDAAHAESSYMMPDEDREALKL